MRKLLLVLFLFIFFVFITISLFNTLTIGTKQQNLTTVELTPIDESNAIQSLSKALSIKTIKLNNDSLVRVLKSDVLLYLKQHFSPIIQSPNIELKILDHHLIFHWKGINQKLQPILYIADLLVEDPSLETLTAWTYSPFMGKVANNKIYGNGSMGSKSAAIALLQAWSELLKEENIPQRSMYVALRFSANEFADWRAVTALFQKSGIQLDAIYSPYSYVSTSACMGIERPIALIGTSIPQKLCARIKGAERRQLTQALKQMQALSFDDSTPNPYDEIFNKVLLPELSFSKQWLGANKGIIGNWLETEIKHSSILNPMFFPNMEVLTLDDHKEGAAIADLCWHLPPHYNITSIKEKLEKRWKAYNFDWYSTGKKIAISPAQGYAFEILQTTIKQTLDNPLVLASTTTRDHDLNRLATLSTKNYQFVPYFYTEEDLNKIATNIDQSISEIAYIKAIGFYHILLKNTLL